MSLIAALEIATGCKRRPHPAGVKLNGTPLWIKSCMSPIRMIYWLNGALGRKIDGKKKLCPHQDTACSTYL